MRQRTAAETDSVMQVHDPINSETRAESHVGRVLTRHVGLKPDLQTMRKEARR